MPAPLLSLESLTDRLQFDPTMLALVSFRSLAVPEQEFITQSADHPVFIVGYLDASKQYRWLTSQQAERVEVTQAGSPGGEKILTAIFSRVGGLDLQVTCQASASPRERFVRFQVSLVNRANLPVIDVQYPFVVCPFNLQGKPGTEAVVLPHAYGSGHLIERPGEAVPAGGAWKQKLDPDCPLQWEISPRMGDCYHYPGMQFAQFLAYYNDRRGLYLACNDAQANIKRFAVLQRGSGMRLGVAHIGDWPAHGERTLEYDVLLGSFSGDWYDAADIYRDWTSQQRWFTPLHQRKDVPDWLVDSPVYLTLRPQGVLDFGPAKPVAEFLPLNEKCIPLLEKVAEKVASPLCVVLMGWERAGSWVYPDAFPPVGGEEGMAEFIRSMRNHGWHAGSFCNGSRWVIGQFWNDYDGEAFYQQHQAESSVCRQADGSLWREGWDATWRPSYACCLGADLTRQTANDFVRHLVSWGMESLQFFDQNNGSSVFPCFSTDHGHPPAPGKWMAQKMAQTMAELNQAAHDLGEKGVVHSAESGLNETCLSLFQETELRTFPPNYGVDVIPLYQYLFHECVILQGMMGNAPEPYHLVLRNAVNGVLGGIPGAVLTGDGTLLDKDTNNWAPWEPHVEDQEAALAMIRAVSSMRHGPGRDFLVMGRMLRPAAVDGILIVEWTYGGRANAVPAVFHSAWQAPDGRGGITLANWTGEEQTATIQIDSILKAEQPMMMHVSADTLTSSPTPVFGGQIKIKLPLHSMVLVEDLPPAPSHRER